MLPPDVPTKLRGRPKKLRRREQWEGGNRSRSSQNTSQIPALQKYTKGKKMHCGSCGKQGHRRNKCPTRPQESEEGNGGNRVNLNFRAKLPVRRSLPGVMIREPNQNPHPTHSYQTQNANSRKGKEKFVVRRRNERPYWLVEQSGRKKQAKDDGMTSQIPEDESILNLDDDGGNF